MAGRLKFFFSYFLFWILAFQAARLLFLLYHFDRARELPAGTLLLSFVHGLRLDLSLAAYLLAPVGLLILLSLHIPFLRRPAPYLAYTWLLVFLTLVLVLADLQLFGEWGFRLDATPLKYLSSPGEVWATMSHLPLFWILLGFALAVFLCCWGAKRFLTRILPWLGDLRHRRAATIVLLLLILSLILPIRGGWQQTPINQSSVYFSSHHFANLLAINAPWNFLHAVTNHAPTSNPYRYLDPTGARAIVDSLLARKGLREQWLRTDRPNVIVVVWESFTAKALDQEVNGVAVTPRFNALKREGLYFSHVYASGDRTDKGIAAVLSGYPALNNVSVIRFPAKSASLQTLSGFFRQRNYATSFYYGGEPEFANMKSYILQGGYGRLVQKSDFPARDQNSKWGAHDGKVADRLLDDLKNAHSQPFFVTWLTLTSHEPFETPDAPAIRGTDNTSRFLNSLHYADKSIHAFVEACRQQPWWNNTLLVIVADHGHPMPEPDNKYDNFRIPMLWLGGALARTGTYDRVCSQIDLAQTLCGQLGADQPLFPFSKDLADPSTREWAFFTFNNGFGLVEPGRHLIFDHVGKQPILTRGLVDSSFFRSGKALQQVTYEDYLLR